MIIQRRHPTFHLLFICIVSFILEGCSQVLVSQDYDREFNFQTPRTYAWQDTLQPPNDDLLAANELLRKRFRSALSATLLKKGYSLTSSPAYLVSSSYKVVSKIDATPYDGSLIFGVDRYGRYGGLGFNSGTNVEPYDQGQLTVNVYSAPTGHLVWTGFATRQVRQHYSPKQLDALAAEMAEAVLTQFPPLQQVDQ